MRKSKGERERSPDRSAEEVVPAAAARLPGGTVLRHLLACVDGSTESEGTLALGLTIARACGASITLLRVLESGPASGSVPGTDALGWELARAEAMEYLEALRARLCPPELEVSLRLEQGHAATSILNAARAIQADLILLGRHGRHGVGDWSLSGTAAEVVAGASSALLLVPFSAQPPSGPRPLGRILVPLDCSQRAECALAPAIRLAGACEAELVLLHAVPQAEVTGSAPLSAEDRELVERLKQRNRAAGESYLQGIQERLGGASDRVRTVLSEAPVLEALTELPEQLGADLVVMAAHGATGSTRWPHGSIAGHMLQSSAQALLVVQDLPAAQLQQCAGHMARPAEASRLGNVHFSAPR